MNLYPNRAQWITIWMAALMFAAALGQGQRRVAVAYAAVGALRAWSQARSRAKHGWALVGTTLLTIVVLFAAVVLLNPKHPG